MPRLKYYNNETNRWEYVDTSKIKTLYQYAVDGGFDGTEEEFATKLASSGHLISSVTLTANEWVDNGNETYSQSVNITNGTVNSLVELQADSSVLLQMINDGVTSIGIINQGGVFTAEAVNAIPTANLTIQCTVIEVSETKDRIVGRPITAGGGGGFVISSTEPTLKKMMWVDSANGKLLKVYDENTQQWIGINAVFA